MDSLRSSLPITPSSTTTLPPTIFLCATCSTPLTSSASLLFFSPPLDSLIFTHLLQPTAPQSLPEPTLPSSTAPDAFCPYYPIPCASPTCHAILGRRYVATTPTMADVAGRWCVAIDKLSIFRLGQEADSPISAAENPVQLSGTPAFPAMVDQNVTRYLHPQPEEVAVWIGKVMQAVVVQQERIEEVTEGIARVERVEKRLGELLVLVKEGRHLQDEGQGEVADKDVGRDVGMETPERKRREVVPDSQGTGGSGTVVGESFVEDFGGVSPEVGGRQKGEVPASVPVKKTVSKPVDHGRRKSSPIRNDPLKPQKVDPRQSVPRRSLQPGIQTVIIASADSDSDSDEAPRSSTRRTPTVTPKVKARPAKDKKAYEETAAKEKDKDAKAKDVRYLRRRRQPLLDSDEDECDKSKIHDSDEDKENDDEGVPVTSASARSNKRRRVEIEVAGREKEKLKEKEKENIGENSPATETTTRRTTRRSGAGLE